MTDAEHNQKIVTGMVDLLKHAAKLRKEIPDAAVADLFITTGISILIGTIGQEMASVHLMHLAEICDADRLEHAADE